MTGKARWAALSMAAGFAVTTAIEPPMARDLSWRAKVHPRVLAARGDEEQEILIVLRERADLSGARQLETRQEKTRYVFERLTEVARRSQEPLLAELEASGADYQSFWITNMIRLRARPASVEALARRGDVARIESDAPLRQRLPLPEELSPRTGLSPEAAQAVRRSGLEPIGDH